MWRRWGKSPPVSRQDPSSSPFSHSFSFSSFKDVQNLSADSPNPKKPSVFHRVRSIAAARLRPSSPPPVEPKQEPKLEPEPKLDLGPKPEPEPHEPSNAESPLLKLEPEPKPEPKLEPEAKPEPEPHEPSNAESPLPSPSTSESEPCIGFPGAESRVVVYYTSLRVVRSTFEDCRTVRSILRGFQVPMDERDLSMDSGFMEELQRILGGEEGGGLAPVTLPRVFIGGRYIGGREEVQRLHEAGELKKFVDGMPAAAPGVCEGCGGYRFVLCEDCNGSCKCYAEKGGGGGFRSCTNCNENGLIRCPSCFSEPSD